MLAGVATQQAQQLPLLFTDEKVLPVEQVEGEVAPASCSQPSNSALRRLSSRPPNRCSAASSGPCAW